MRKNCKLTFCCIKVKYAHPIKHKFYGKRKTVQEYKTCVLQAHTYTHAYISTKLWDLFSIHQKKKKTNLDKKTLADFISGIPLPPLGIMTDRHTKILDLDGTCFSGA